MNSIVLLIILEVEHGVLTVVTNNYVLIKNVICVIIIVSLAIP